MVQINKDKPLFFLSLSTPFPPNQSNSYVLYLFFFFFFFFGWGLQTPHNYIGRQVFIRKQLGRVIYIAPLPFGCITYGWKSCWRYVFVSALLTIQVTNSSLYILSLMFIYIYIYIHIIGRFSLLLPIGEFKHLHTFFDTYMYILTFQGKP